MPADMSVFYLRVPTALRQAFEQRSTGLGKPTRVLRELIEAFADGRITIERHITIKENEQ